MLNDIITASGASRTKWANDLGISKSYFSDILSGKKRPSLDLAVRIERATGGRVVAASWVPDDNAPTKENTA